MYDMKWFLWLYDMYTVHICDLNRFNDMQISPLSVSTSTWWTCKILQARRSWRATHYTLQDKSPCAMPTNYFLSNPAPGQYVYNSYGGRQDTWKCSGLCLARLGDCRWEYWPWHWDFGRLKCSWTWSLDHPEIQPVDVYNRSCVIFS